jgi:hypothetical protein
MAVLLAGDGRTMPSHFDPALLALAETNHSLLREIYELDAETVRRQDPCDWSDGVQTYEYDISKLAFLQWDA